MIVLHAAETIKGGVATVINSLIEHQSKQSDIEEIICLVPSDQHENLNNNNDNDNDNDNNIRKSIFKRNNRNIMGMIAFFLTILKIIKADKPNVVHLHSSFAGLIGRLAILLSGRRSKTKVIYCPHAFGFLMQTSSLKKKVYSFVELTLSKFTDKIICVSQSEYDSAVKAGFKKKKLTVIHNGVPLKEKSNTFTSNNKTHYKLLFVGRFDYQKGIDILSSSIKMLAAHSSNISYEFTLIGEAVNSESEIIFQEADNIKVTQLGWLKPEQLEEQYLSHDALILPSRWEGFAMVPLEAMSYSLPIIASDISTFRELETNENHIIFFKDKEELAKIFNTIANIDLELKREISKKVFENNFSEEKMKNSTYILYK